MAYKQNAGRGNSAKTGAGIPSPLLQVQEKPKPAKKPNFSGSTDKGEMGGGHMAGATANTDLLKVGKYYGGKVIDKIKEGAQYLSDAAEGKKGSKGYSGGDESMRQKNLARKK